MKKVSIIVAVYNVEKYLDKCLKSIIGQNYKNVEIIVVNDGATDGSYKIIQKYQENPNVIIVNKPNGGLSDARNAGLKIASGEYILFVDGDDWLDKECLNKCSKYMESNIDIIMFSFIREYGDVSKKARLFDLNYIEFEGEEKLKLERRLVGPIGKELKQAHKMEDLNPVWNKLYKKTIILGSYFTDTKKIGTEDLWYNLPLFSKAKKIIYIDIEGYHYNKMNDNSLTRVYNKYLLTRWKNLYKIIFEYISQYSDDTYRKALENRKVINLLALTRNIVESNLSKREKFIELDKLLNEPMYEEAFSDFEFKYLSLVWKVFYFMCKNKMSMSIYIFMTIAKGAKKWL